MAGALVVGVGLAKPNLWRYRQLAARGVAESGRVTGLEPLNHQFVDYSYEVGGRVLSSTGSAGFGNPGFGVLRVGDRVSISYLPDNPYFSCLGDPHLLLRSEAISVLLAAVLFPSLVLGGFATRYSRFRQWLLR
jgi:hypothetical protein